MDKSKWDQDAMEEDDPMIEDIDEYEDDEPTDRYAMTDSARRASLMRGGRGGSISDLYRSYPEVLDEKGELAAVIPPEKLVHQNFFNEFPDDFDDNDLA